MKILLVGNYALDRQASMLRYAEMLRRGLVAAGHEVEVVRPVPVFGRLAKHPTVEKWLGYLDKFFLFPGQLRRRARGFDLVHICDHSNSMYLGAVRGVPSSITCHDLLAVASARGEFADQQVSTTGRLLQGWIARGLSGARDVVCVSTETARKLEVLAPAKGERRSEVILNPLHRPFEPASSAAVQAVRLKLGLAADERYVLHVGGNQWYKNRPGVVRIFAEMQQQLRAMQREPVRLVMAGKAFTGELRELVAALGLAGAVVEWVDGTDDELAAAYTGATALLFPSLYEGFGWPVVEAQSCGCPVVCSNRAPMTEVAGGAAILIDPLEEVAAGRLMACEWERLAGLREAGFENARRFTTPEVMPRYERFFAEVVGRSR